MGGIDFGMGNMDFGKDGTQLRIRRTNKRLPRHKYSYANTVIQVKYDLHVHKLG